MGRRKKDRSMACGLKMTEEVRFLFEQLTAHFTLKMGKRHNLTDVLEEAIRRLAKDEGISTVRAHS